MQTVNNQTQTNTWASLQHIDFDGSAFDEGSLQIVYTDATTAAKTFGGVQEVDKVTLPAKASATNGDYFVINDYLGASWSVALDTLGTAAATPTGAAWVAIPAANKVYLDISATTTAASVSTAVHSALVALTGFTAVITAVTSTADQNCTAAYANVVAAPSVYSRAGAAGTGSIVVAVTTPGTASGVNTTTDTITKVAHGQVTGAKVALTTAGTLPAGLSATNYWVVYVTADTFKLATSLVNSAAGTVVDLTTPGIGTHTITPTSLATTGAVCKLQISNDGATFSDVTSQTTTITAAGSVFWDLVVVATGVRLHAKTVRVLFTPTTGSVGLSVTPYFVKY